MTKYLPQIIAVIMIAVGVFFVGRGCGQKSRDSEIQQLSNKLASSQKTVELSNGLYAKATVQIADLSKSLDTSVKSVADLKTELTKTGDQLLTTQTLVLKLQGTYQAKLPAKQTSVSIGTTKPSASGNISLPAAASRQRIDFVGDLGPFHVMGYTITDPAESQVAVNQVRPIKLTVGVAKTPQGTWSTFVASSEPNLNVDVAFSGVDLSTVSRTWRQRLRIDVGAYPLGTGAFSYGLSYDFDRFSLGAGCVHSFGNDVQSSCGLTLGLRPFN